MDTVPFQCGFEQDTDTDRNAATNADIDNREATPKKRLARL